MFGSNQHRPELPCSHTPSHRNPRANIYSEAFMLTSVSWSPFSSRVQKVLGPSPSTRVCLQCILFSDSQVAKLCRQKENKQDPRLFRFALINIRCLSGQLRMREFVLFFFFLWVCSLKTIWSSSSSSRCLRGWYAITISKMSNVLLGPCRLQTL